MTTIRSSTQSGLAVQSDNSANITFVTGQSNINLKAYSSGLVEIPSTSRLVVPVGNTVARTSAGETGAVRFNTDTQKFEIFQGSFWSPLTTGDPFYDDIILHITGDGGNNVKNDTYIDESANAFVVTKFGNPIQGSFNPYQTGWSVFLDNAGDFISNSSSTSRFAFYSGGNYDYTVEGWIYQVGTRAIPNEGRDVIYDQRTSSDDGSGPVLAITGSTGQLELSANTQTNSSARNRSANVIIPNQWNHIAFVKQSNTYYYYINGIQDANTFVFTPFSGTAPKIGGTNLSGALESGNASGFHGFISNFRVTRSAVYSNSFVVPTAPLTALPNTVILTCQDPYIQDNSDLRNTLVLNGEATPVPFSPFGRSNVKYNANINGGSIFFDGLSADYLTIPYDSRQNIGANVQYCFEFWHYPTGLGEISSGEHVVVNRNWNFGTGGPTWGLTLNNGITPTLNIEGTGTALYTLHSSARSGQRRQWNHYVFTRDFTGMNRIFVNGILGVATSDTRALSNVVGDVFIGTSSSRQANVKGYISGLHMIVGDSIPLLYKTTNTTVGANIFAPPTVPPQRNSNTVFLLNFENAGVYDSRQNNSIETIGDVKIVTSNAPTHYYGNSALSFNGNSFLSVPLKSEQRFNTNPLTIESWIYRTNSNTHTIFDMGNTSSGEGLRMSVIDNLLVLQEGWANVSITSSTPGSVRFAGLTSDDCVEYPSNNIVKPYKFGSNNFTIEYWIYPERVSNDAHMAVWSGGGAWHLSHYANLSVCFVHGTSTGTPTLSVGTGTAALTANAWNHVAVTKQWPEDGSKTAGNLRIFINGLLQGANTRHVSAVELYTSTNKALRLGVGPDRTSIYPYPGQIKLADVRITNGECLYTANFTVPNSPLTILNANTVFLSCQHGLEDSSRFQTPCFVPRLSVSNGNVLLVKDSPFNEANLRTNVSTNTWVHIAAVRSSNLGNQTSLYINGRRVANGTIRNNFFNANATIMIGANQLMANGFSGFIKDFRITREARYTTDFTPPVKMPDRNS